MAAFHPQIRFGEDIDDDDDARMLAAAGGAPTSVDLFGLGIETRQTTGEDAPDGVPPSDPRRAAAYHALRPEPNYSEFSPEFVDQHGREYSVAKAGTFLEQQQDVVANATFTAPSLSGDDVSPRRLLLFLRMPINHRWQTELPDPDGEKLELYHVSTQVLCRAVTEGVFVQPRARTGHVYVRGFESLGQVSNPASYESWLRVSARDPGAQWF